MSTITLMPSFTKEALFNVENINLHFPVDADEDLTIEDIIAIEKGKRQFEKGEVLSREEAFNF